MALRRPPARGRLFGLAIVAVLSAVLSGCVGEGRHLLTLVEGTGYSTTVVGANLSSDLGDAAMSPDGRAIALLYLNGTVEIRLLNGSLVSSWHTDEAPLDCLEKRGCGVEFLPNGTLLAYTKSAVAIFATNGSALWNWSPPAIAGSIRVLEAGANGSLLVIGYNNRSAEILNLDTGTSYPLPVEGDGLLWDVSASERAEVVATASGVVGIYDSGRHLLAEVVRWGDVEVSADGRTAFVWGRQGTVSNDLVRIDLTTIPPTVQNITVRDALAPSSLQEAAENRLFISPLGRFAALRAEVELSSCPPGNAPCAPRENHHYVRVFDAQEPSADYGFTANRPIRVFLEDDGSAFAVATVLLAPGAFHLEFTTASPRATPPHAV